MQLSGCAPAQDNNNGSFDCQVNYVFSCWVHCCSLIIVWVIWSVGSSGYTGSQVSEPVQHRAWLIAFQCALRLWGKFGRRPKVHEALRPRRGAHDHPSIQLSVNIQVHASFLLVLVSPRLRHMHRLILVFFG